MTAFFPHSIASSLLALTACAGLMTGCSSDDTGESNSESATSTATTSTSSTTSAETETATGTAGTSTTTTADPTTSTSSTSTTGSTTDGETGGVVMCDPVLQDCPDGEKCSAYEITPGAYWEANKCVPVMGDKQVGDGCDVLTINEPASGIDDCGPGLICLEVNADGSDGICYEFCGEGETCEVNNGFCIVANGGALPICLILCDPLVQDCPTADQACIGSVVDGAFICYKSDTSESPGMDNDECAFDNACLPGFQCQPPSTVDSCDPGFMGCCNPFCALDGDASECSGAEVCSAFFPEPTPPWENVGLCTLP